MGLNDKTKLQIQALFLSSGLPIILFIFEGGLPIILKNKVAFLQLVKDYSLIFFIHFFVGLVNFNIYLLSIYYISIICSALWGKSEGGEIVIIVATF